MIKLKTWLFWNNSFLEAELLLSLIQKCPFHDLPGSKKHDDEVLYIVFGVFFWNFLNHKECVTLKTFYIVYWWSYAYFFFLSRTGFWLGLLVLNCSVLHSIKLVKVTVPGMIDGLQKSFHLSWKRQDKALWLWTKLANCHQEKDLLLFVKQ